MSKKIKQLNNVFICTDDNNQEYVRLYKDKWMLYEGDDEIINPDHLEDKFFTLLNKQTNKKKKTNKHPLYDSETISAMSQLLQLIADKKISVKQIKQLTKKRNTK